MDPNELVELQIFRAPDRELAGSGYADSAFRAASEKPAADATGQRRRGGAVSATGRGVAARRWPGCSAISASQQRNRGGTRRAPVSLRCSAWRR